MTGDVREQAVELHAQAMEIYLGELLTAAPGRESGPAPAEAGGTVEVPGRDDASAAAPASGSVLEAGAEVYRLIPAAGMAIALLEREIQWQGPFGDLDLAPGRSPAWCMGKLDADGRVRHVVDLAQVVAPGIATRATHGAAIHLVCGYWTLVCDAIGEQIVLTGAQVRWRRPSESRPWLVGTAQSPRCAVIDVIGLTSLLSAEIGNE